MSLATLSAVTMVSVVAMLRDVEGCQRAQRDFKGTEGHGVNLIRGCQETLRVVICQDMLKDGVGCQVTLKGGE